MSSKKPPKRASAPAQGPRSVTTPRTPRNRKPETGKPNAGAASRPTEEPGSSPGTPEIPPGGHHPVTPIPSFTPKGLTPLQHRFTQEYLVDLSGTKAYLRASPDASYDTAGSEAARLLATPRIAQEIQRLMDERAAITGVTADRVLFKLWERATADVRELVEYRIGSCRYCWGIYNQYQYTDAEFSAAQDKHIREQADKARKKDGYEPVPFPEKGGCGYVHDRPPNPECPECWGRGQGEPVIHDTRGYSDGAKAIYGGIKLTKDGVNVIVESRTDALQLIGRHLGMWNDKIKVESPEANPLMALLQQIQEAHSTLPIVHDDPELRGRPGVVDDVVAKPRKTEEPGSSPQRKPSKWRAA
jgi:phage terminase small subunit